MTTKNKYILQLCHSYTTPFLDVARQYASLFDDSDYQVITVYLMGERNEDVIHQSASDKVIFLKNHSKDLRGLKRKQIKQMKQICKQYDFEFAIAHRYKAIFILQHIKDLPVIGVNHAFGNYLRFTRRWFTTRYHKDLYLLGVSNAIRDDIKKCLPKYPQQQIQTLYNRIDIEQVIINQLDPARARDYLNLPHDKYIFANVGRLHPDKDQRTLINAFAKIAPTLPNTVLCILGKGRLEKELKQQAKQLQLEERILFLGVVPNAVNYFRAFDSFVLSSNREPFGMVLLEAIAAQLPVIATNAGGAKEIIQNTQWLFDIRDSKRLAKLMLNIYALEKPQKEALNKQNIQWLKQNFTDKAVKNAFWKLPFPPLLQ